MNRLACVLLLATTLVPAQAPDDCTLGEVKPIVRETREHKVERLSGGPRDLTERTQLRPGLSVTVVQGGCAHYGVKFVFAIERPQPQQPLLAEAAALLRALKPRLDSHVLAATLEVLDRHKSRPYQPGDVLQDRSYPDVTLYVDARADEGKRVVEISYSFVL